MEGLPGHPLRRPRRRAGRRPAGVERQLSAVRPPARRIVLLRHGRTADNADGRFQGQLDTPLDAVGRAQADAAAQVLASPPPVVLLSSDLARARATADPLARASGLTCTVDARLRELDLGAWQGLTSVQARAAFPDEHEAWRAGVDVPRGGGETYRQAGERAVHCLLEHLPAVPPGGVLLAVTHGGTARAALGTLLDLPADVWSRLAALGNCCWSVLGEHSHGWRLEQHGTGLALPYTAPPPLPAAEPSRAGGGADGRSL